MKNNNMSDKSFLLTIRVVNLCKYLMVEKMEHIPSKQVYRSVTCVGAMISESGYKKSKNDFLHKLSIVQKEINKTIYWLSLLSSPNYLITKQFDCLKMDAIERLKTLTALMKNTKSNRSLTTYN